MSVLALTALEFEPLISGQELVIIYFWAAWCAPCKQFSKVYEQVSLEYSDCVFAKVNIEEEQALLDSFGIVSIPYLMIFKKGFVIYAEAGSIPESTLRELVHQAVEVDMEQLMVEAK